MASDQRIVEHVCEQGAGAGRLTHRRMFGEYAVYLEGTVVGFVCDNQFFLKPTDAGRALLETVTEGAPYPGAKPHLLLGDELDDRVLLARLLRATLQALPPPKAKTMSKATPKAASKATPKARPRPG